MNWETFYLGLFCDRLRFQPAVVGVGIARTCTCTCPVAGTRTAASRRIGQRKPGLRPFNFGTLAAFLAWFGGTGYLLTRYSSVWALLALALAFVSGLGGAAAVFLVSGQSSAAARTRLDPGGLRHDRRAGTREQPGAAGRHGRNDFFAERHRGARPAFAARTGKPSRRARKWW